MASDMLGSDSDGTPSRLEQLCLDKGLKMTDQRRIIARVLSDSADHPDVEQVYRRASAIDSHISIATVYRTVRLFEEANILARHDFGDGRARYEEMPSAHHDHLIDLQSGRGSAAAMAPLASSISSPGRCRCGWPRRPPISMPRRRCATASSTSGWGRGRRPRWR